MSVNLGRVAYVEKGEYDGGTTYESKDVVSFNGGSYVFIGDTPAANVPPTDEAHWQPLIDPTAMNEKIAELDGVKQETLTAAATASNKAQEATTAAETANTAAEAADNARLAIADELNKKAPAIFVDASGDMVHITDGAEGMPVQSLITHVEPKQEGEGDPSPDNVRPIAGWDEVSATRMGKNLANLFDFNRTLHSVVIAAKDGIVTMNGTSSANSTSVLLWKSTLKPGTYTLSHKVLSGSMTGAAAAASVLSGAGVRTRLNAPAATFTLEEETICSFNIVLATSTVTYDNFTFSVQLEKGDTATEFEPPNMQTLTAALPETLYGFDKNWTDGIVKVTELRYVITGKESIYTATTTGDGKRFSLVMPYEMKKTYPTTAVAENAMCSHYKTESEHSLYTGSQGFSANLQIYFADSRFSTAAEIKTYFAEQYAAGTPVTVVYTLAEPYTIQLTPKQLATLKGVNNIWSDAGQTEVNYAADTKMYIDQKIAAIAAAIV